MRVTVTTLGDDPPPSAPMAPGSEEPEPDGFEAERASKLAERAQRAARSLEAREEAAEAAAACLVTQFDRGSYELDREALGAILRGRGNAIGIDLGGEVVPCWWKGKVREAFDAIGRRAADFRVAIDPRKLLGHCYSDDWLLVFTWGPRGRLALFSESPGGMGAPRKLTWEEQQERKKAKLKPLQGRHVELVIYKPTLPGGKP